MKALLVVDVQNDFCPGGALAVEKGDQVIPVINKLMDKFDLIVASRDNHPENSSHFKTWPKHCIKGTRGADFHDDLDTTKINQVFFKGTGQDDDGYSAFQATNLNLEDYLKEKDVSELYVTGLATDYCVKNSAIDAARKGFSTFLVKDAVKGVNLKPDDSEKAINEMKQAGVQVIESKTIK